MSIFHSGVYLGVEETVDRLFDAIHENPVSDLRAMVAVMRLADYHPYVIGQRVLNQSFRLGIPGMANAGPFTLSDDARRAIEGTVGARTLVESPSELTTMVTYAGEVALRKYYS